MNRIEGKVVLVTGASSGIGKALAGYLAEKGARVYGTSRKASEAEAFGPADRGFPRMIRLDVCSGDSVAEAVRRVMGLEGRIDVLINNAGFGLAGAVEDVSIEEAYAQFDTNFFGVLRTCREVMPIMRAQGGGLIVNVSSVAGLVSLPYQSMYSASKYAVEAITEAIRMEARPFGIRAVLVEPGDTKTGCTANRRMAAANAGSAYGKRCEKAVATMAKSEQGASEPRTILRVVDRLVRMRNPPVRVAVGFENKLLVLLIRSMPARVLGFLMSKIY
jgi:NAD(P)-dependent dehydrogenase (short-subunit alcohol dehydrogenase family)